MINRLIKKIQETKAPVCVGLDPMLSYIPEHVVKKAFEEYGGDPGGSCRGHLAVQQGDRGPHLGSDPGGKAPDRHVRAVRNTGTDGV